MSSGVVSVNPLPAILATLNASAAVTGAAGGRVYGNRLPTPVVLDATIPDRPAPAVVVSLQPGVAWPENNLTQPRVLVRAYAAQDSAANALLGAALAALCGRVVSVGRVSFVVSSLTTPVDLVESGTSWSYSQSLLSLIVTGG